MANYIFLYFSFEKGATENSCLAVAVAFGWIHNTKSVHANGTSQFFENIWEIHLFCTMSPCRVQPQRTPFLIKIPKKSSESIEPNPLSELAVWLVLPGHMIDWTSPPTDLWQNVVTATACCYSFKGHFLGEKPSNWQREKKDKVCPLWGVCCVVRLKREASPMVLLL